MCQRGTAQLAYIQQKAPLCCNLSGRDRGPAPCLACCRAVTGQAAEVHPQRSKRREAHCCGAVSPLRGCQHLDSPAEHTS